MPVVVAATGAWYDVAHSGTVGAVYVCGPDVGGRACCARYDCG